MNENYDIVQVRLENDNVWEPILRCDDIDDTAVKAFCAYHPEYYDISVKLDGYKELIVEVKDTDGKEIRKYAVYIDRDSKIFVKWLKNTVL